MKTTLRLVVLLVLVAVGGWGWRTHAALRETPVPATAAASRGDVAETVLATGVIEAQKLVSVGARVSGQIETLAVHLGQEVAEGDLIATIDSQDQKNAVLQAEAESGADRGADRRQGRQSGKGAAGLRPAVRAS